MILCKILSLDKKIFYHKILNLGLFRYYFTKSATLYRVGYVGKTCGY